jgi:hypothetical protein
MSAIHRIAIAGDAVQAEARCLAGEKKGDFRVKASTYAGMDGILQQIQDYYQRLVNEVKRGERKPIALGSWKGVMKESNRFILERIPHNFAQFKKASIPNDVRVALIPCSFTAPHPTVEEKEAYMARWNDEGDFYKKVMAECRKHTNDNVVVSPQVVHSADPKSLLMVCVAVIVYPK